MGAVLLWVRFKEAGVFFDADDLIVLVALDFLTEEEEDEDFLVRFRCGGGGGSWWAVREDRARFCRDEDDLRMRLSISRITQNLYV